jgi:hypothetical protein
LIDIRFENSFCFNNTPSFGFHWQCGSVLGSLTPKKVEDLWMVGSPNLDVEQPKVCDELCQSSARTGSPERIAIGSRDILRRALAMRMLS